MTARPVSLSLRSGERAGVRGRTLQAPKALKAPLTGPSVDLSPLRRERP